MDAELNKLYTNVAEILQKAKQQVKTAVNLAMVYAYYNIGKMIVEEEQKGEIRAEYGKYVLQNLAEYLTDKFGKGYSFSNLKQMRQFYLVYSKNEIVTSQQSNSGKQIGQTVSVQSESKMTKTASEKFCLSWSHYLKLMRITNVEERRFYEIEAYKNDWSLRELKRQYDSSLYERLLLSTDKDKVKQLSEVGQLIEKPEDIVKDPYVFEFLGIPEMPVYSETELETRLIDNLQIYASKYETVLPSKEELGKLLSEDGKIVGKS